MLSSASANSPQTAKGALFPGICSCSRTCAEEGACSFFLLAASALVISRLHVELAALFFSPSRAAAELWAFCFRSFSSFCRRASLTSCLRRATHQASPAFPVFPRACGSLLSPSCLLSSFRRSFLWHFFCSFSFLAACRRAKYDGFVHEAFLQRAAPRPFSRALVLSLPRLFWPVRPFEPLPGSPGGALTARSLLLCSWPARCLSQGGPV